MPCSKHFIGISTDHSPVRRGEAGPMLYNPRLDNFTREYALQLAAGVRRSAAAVHAAEAAGYPRRSSPEVFASNARKRAARPDVQARVAELMAPALAKAQAELDATVERVTRNLVQILECPLDPADVRAADHIAAVRVLADLHGWNAPKKVAPTNPKGDGPPGGARRAGSGPYKC